MRFSKFVFTYPDGKRTLLFNAAGERLFVLTPDLAELLARYANHPEELQAVHPSFYEQLVATRSLVPDDFDEAEALVDEWKATDRDSTHFGIIVNPTLNCNLRCWYCYENHAAGSVISESTRDAILKFIETKASEPQLRNLNVSFFGGEPLLSFDKAVLPLLRFASDVCAANDVRLFSNFTTNAVLLTEEVLSALNAIPMAKLPTFQITFDGNRNWHDNVRFGLNRKPTYDVIFLHVRQALQAGNEVFVRFNYTRDNILTFLDVLEDFKTHGLSDYTEILSVKFEHVWQDAPNRESVKDNLFKVRDAFKAAGFRVGTDNIHYRHVCYADSPNHMVINYNGDIFKCTARDFRSAEREGILHEDGHVELNDVFNRRMQVRFDNPACLACRILPLCNGGCSQSKLETSSRTECYRHMSDEDKETYVKARLEEIMNQMQ